MTLNPRMRRQPSERQRLTVTPKAHRQKAIAPSTSWWMEPGSFYSRAKQEESRMRVSDVGRVKQERGE